MARSFEQGFTGNVPQTSADIETALRHGLLSLDANVLLNFYRYSPKALEALVAVLRAADDRVWISNQAAREFWRNRIVAIDGRSQASRTLEAALDKSDTALQSAVDTWAKQTAVPEETKKEVINALASGVEKARSLISGEAGGAGDIAYDGSKDPILDLLHETFTCHVGDALPSDEQAAAMAEADRRVKDQIPPGYMDAAKDIEGTDGAAGDYLVWFQSIKEAVDRGLPLVIVTGDEKEDWWWRHRNALLGPRAELVAEFANHSSEKLYMVRPVQLIEYASALNVEVSAEAAADVARANSDGDGNEWTRHAVSELLRRLDQEGREQAEVIREAARLGGVIDRDAVYALAEYDEARMLRGFTRPTARITRDLQEEGLLGEGVRPALTSIYDGGVTALRFEIPPEFVELLAEYEGSARATIELSGSA